jgi:AraC family transcriptional regulator
MKLYIKNMVCDRCNMVVRQVLEGLQYEVKEVMLGEAEIKPEPDNNGLEKIEQEFFKVGFELVKDRKQKLVEKIKTLIIEKLNKDDLHLEINLSDYLAEKAGFDYHYISHVFSETENSTIEKFVISKKVEKIKELIRYGEINIGEIAWKLGYSSIQALSSQFKKVTGMTPSEYKKAEMKNKEQSI